VIVVAAYFATAAVVGMHFASQSFCFVGLFAVFASSE
jgi:hypothetical protein